MLKNILVTVFKIVIMLKLNLYVNFVYEVSLKNLPYVHNLNIHFNFLEHGIKMLI